MRIHLTPPQLIIWRTLSWDQFGRGVSTMALVGASVLCASWKKERQISDEFSPWEGKAFPSRLMCGLHTTSFWERNTMFLTRKYHLGSGKIVWELRMFFRCSFWGGSGRGTDLLNQRSCRPRRLCKQVSYCLWCNKQKRDVYCLTHSLNTTRPHILPVGCPHVPVVHLLLMTVAVAYELIHGTTLPSLILRPLTKRSLIVCWF